MYQIREWKFDPTRCTLTNDEFPDSVHRIENKHSLLLTCLIENQGDVVSKESLYEFAWGGRYTSDNNISAKISELRKILGDNYQAPNFIKTHHQRGYSLISPVTEIKSETIGECEPENVQAVQKSTYTIFFILIALLLFAVVGYSILGKDSASEPPSIEQTILTYLEGQEYSPDLSHDGQYLVFTHRESLHEKWQIKLKDLETGFIEDLTSNSFNNESPIFSSDSSEIFYLENAENSCRIIKVSNPLMTNARSSEVLADCGNITNISPLSLDSNDEWLYYSYVESDSNIFSIRRINTRTQTIENITAPPSYGFGDYSSALSHEGKKLALLRAAGTDSTELLVLTLSTRELRKVAEFNHTLYRVAWSQDDKSLYFYASNNDLIVLNTESLEEKVVQEVEQKQTFLKPDKQSNLLTVTGQLYNDDLYAFRLSSSSNGYELDRLTNSSFKESSPAPMNKSSSFAFISNRSGKNQIWLQDAQVLKQLTNFSEEHHLSNLIFTSGEQWLAYYKDGKVFALNMETFKEVELLSDLEIKANGSISVTCNSESILTTVYLDDSWRLYEIDLSTNQKTQRSLDSRNIKTDCSKNLHYVVNNYGNILVKSQSWDTLSTLSIPERMEGDNSWDMHDDKLFYFKEGQLKVFDTISEQFIELDIKIQDAWDLSVHEGHIFFPLKKAHEMNIELIRLKPN